MSKEERCIFWGRHLPPQTENQTRQSLTYCGRKMVLTLGATSLYETLGRLEQHPDGHLLQPCDIGIWTDCQNAADRIAEQFGHLNLLINNAFGAGEKSLAEMDPGDIHDFFETSVTGTALLTKSMLSLLACGAKASGGTKSQIINVVADWGFPMHNVMTGTPTYVAAKYAVHGFGVALHRETAEVGVNVTNLYPGIVASSVDLDAPIDEIRTEFGDHAIPMQDLVDLVLAVTSLRSSVVRHLVLSPDNPQYNGL